MLRGLVKLIRRMDGLTQAADARVLRELLEEADVHRDDMTAACKFDEVSYARNTLAKSPWYELLVICWKEGQASLIHDHGGSNCGVRVVDGVASETIFKKDAEGAVHPVAEREYSRGDVCVNSGPDIHVITNEQHSQDLITLHLYSPPLEMNFFSQQESSRGAAPDGGGLIT